MNNEIYAGALELIPGYLRNEVKLDAVLSSKAEEIRLRAGRKATVLVGEREIITGKIPITSLDLERVLEIATGASAYSFASRIYYGERRIQNRRLRQCCSEKRRDSGLS